MKRVIFALGVLLVFACSKTEVPATPPTPVVQDYIGNKNKVTTRIDGVHQIYLQDPDGYWIEINDDNF